MSTRNIKPQNETECKDNPFVAKRVEILESEIQQQKEILEREIQHQKNMKEKQSKRMDELEKVINELKEQGIHTIREENLDKQGTEFSGTSQGLGDMTISRNIVQKRQFLLGGSVDTMIGFTAYMDHTVQNLGIDQILVFNKVLFNDGGWYNNGSGIFTCPENGVYLFFFEVCAQDGKQIVAKLVVNGVNEVDGIADNEYIQTEGQGSNMAILRLARGMHVAVENYRWGQVTSLSSSTDRFNTFSGILLYQ